MRDNQGYEQRTKGGSKPTCGERMPGAGLNKRHGGKAPSEMPAFQPYWGKPAVRNDRGGRGNVGIIRSPVRASILPDSGSFRVEIIFAGSQAPAWEPSLEAPASFPILPSPANLYQSVTSSVIPGTAITPVMRGPWEPAKAEKPWVPAQAACGNDGLGHVSLVSMPELGNQRNKGLRSRIQRLLRSL